MRTYHVEIWPQNGAARVHIESWGEEGFDPECHKGTLTVRETNQLREAINVLAFLLDDCDPGDIRWAHVRNED